MNPISRIVYPLIEKGYINSWSFFHALKGAVVGFVAQQFLLPFESLMVVLAVAVGWEIYELISEGLKPYGYDLGVWFKDSICDVTIEMMVGGLVVL